MICDKCGLKYIIIEILSLAKIFEILQYLTKKKLLKIFGEKKIVIPPTGFELMTNRLVVKPLTYCATLLGYSIGKETT